MKTVFSIIFAFLLYGTLFGQNNREQSSVPINPGQPADILESFSAKLNAFNILEKVKQRENASEPDFSLFLDYYHDKIYGDDRNVFWKLVQNNSIKTDADIKNYANNKIDEYAQLYQNFLSIKSAYPSSIIEYANRKHTPSAPSIPCNPACDNIDFENGTLSGWSAYYATNTSNASAFSNTLPVGGVCGAVTKSAYDPTSLTYQVSIMSGTGFDPVAGPFIPVVCPTGGLYSCRIGDSTKNGAQIGILQQTFTVTNANDNFIYMYAVVLENPSHSFYEQPYFNVQLLDSNGNLITSCGNYSVVSGPGLFGFKAVYYPTDGDTVYCKPWSTVFVPLQAYLGQCITIKITAADCSLGGHFGYAYFDATCSAGLISSSPVICGKNVTISAPPGASSYKWSGGCIVGSNTNQNITVSCAGTYKVILTSISNAICSDTLSITITAATPPSVTLSCTNVSCHGGRNGTATAVVSSGTPPYKYLWLPSGGTNLSASNLSAGTYTFTVLDSNQCSDTASITITQPPVLTATINSIVNVACNKDSTGSLNVLAGGGTPGYNYVWAPVGGTNSSANNLSAGTYTVTVKDSHGCSVTATATITQPTALNAVTSVTASVSCNGGNNGSAKVTASGGTPAYTYSWSNGETTTNATGLSAGTYTITVTDANHCSIKATVIITQPPILTATISVSSEVSCNGGNNGAASVTAGGGTPAYKYLWSNGKTTTAINTLTAGTYNVTVTDAHGCTATASVAITQPPVLTASISSYTSVSCAGGNNGNATVSASGGTPNYTYLWSDGQTSSTAITLTSGTYSVTVTDADGCHASTNVTITQPSALLASTSVISNVSCNGGNNGSAKVSVLGGVPAYTYSWSNGQTTSTINSLTSGIYNVNITDANGCTVSASVTITQPPVLTVSSSVLANVSCNGGSNGIAGSSASGGTPSYIYSWSNGETTANATGLSAGTYTISVTDTNGCSASANATITQPTALIAGISSTPSTCSNPNGSATVSASGGTPSYKYLWSNGETSSTANGLIAGSYSVTVTDAHGCKVIALVTVRSIPGETASITSFTNIPCNGGNNGSATVTALGGTLPYTYTWSNGETSNNATGLTAGSYTIIVHDSNGCIAFDSVIITQPAVIKLTITTTPVVCNGGSTGSAKVSATGGNPSYTYSWAPGGQTSANITGLSAGTYTISVTDANGCKVNANVTITQASALTLVAAGFPASCNGEANGQATVIPSGGTNPYTYKWSNGSTDANANNLAAGNYTITVTDANGCAHDTVVKVSQPPPILVNFSADTLNGCSPLCTDFKDFSKDSASVITKWRWNFGDGTTDTIKDPRHCYSAPGQYSVTLTVSDNHDCSANKTISNMITVYSHPVAAFTYSPQNPDILAPTVKFTDLSSDAYGIKGWLWSFSDNPDSVNLLQNPTHTYSDTGKYCIRLTVTNLYGCTDSTTNCLDIHADFTFYIPDAFSPNGDGINDIFTPKGEHIQSYEMYIFDRWGMLLFHTEDINKGWDGTVNGTVCQEDTYVYLVNLKDNKGSAHSYIGKVTLVR